MISKTDGRLSTLLQNVHGPEKIMEKKDTAQSLLRNLPGVDRILELIKNDSHFEDLPKMIVVRSIRAVIDDLRQSILKPDASFEKEIIECSYR